MSFNLSKLIQSLKQQKQKYHAKVLSSNAIYVNWLRVLDTSDLFAEWVWLIIPPFDFSALALTLLLDIQPFELQPINWNFNVRLPDLNELLMGIMIVIDKIILEEKWKWMKALKDFINENFVDVIVYINPVTGQLTTITNIHDTLYNKRMFKGVYDETQYDKSYYDPNAFREFVSKTLTRLWLQFRTDINVKDTYEQVAQALNIADFIKKYHYNRISMVYHAQKNVMILGYGVLGESYLGEEEKVYNVKMAKMKFMDYDGNIVEYKSNTLDQVQHGFILGLTPLGFGYLMPPVTIYTKPVQRVENPFAGRIETEGDTPFVKLSYWRARNIQQQYYYNNLVFANYNKPEEQQSYQRSERTDQWFNLQLIRYMVEHVADPIIRKYESNPMKIRMYKSAVLQLVNIKAKRHTWGWDGFYSMSDEEAKEWWINHWKAQGLKQEVLEEIYNRLITWLKEVAQTKMLIGLRVKQRRYSLAQLK